MFRKLLVAAVALVVAAVAFVFVDRAADAAAASVTITATQATTGTTTLTYRATVLKAGTIREVTMAIPAGTTGRVTSVNGTVSSVTRTVLRWRPSRVVNVAVGARLAIPLYGLKLPAGGPWTLGFKSIGTANQVITSGAGVLQPIRTYTPQVAVYTSNPVPGQTTNLVYQATITRAGTLAAVRMQLPTDATGTYTTLNGTLAVSGGFATWTPKAPISVAAGARLGIPVNGVKLSRFGGAMSLNVSATTSTGTVLTSGSTTVTYIAPPAEMPALAEEAVAGPAADCPKTWPATATENAKTGTGDWVITTAADPDLAAYLTKVSATCGDTVDLKVTSGNNVSVIAYRMGYYGGLGAREVWRADDVPTVVQPKPTTGGVTEDGKPLNMTTAESWTKTLTIPVDKTWVPGTYLIKVVDGTSATYAPLTVRDDTGTKHALLIQQATATWQAYNSYGGVSFYTSLSAGSGRLTFDRPYNEGQGSGQYLTLEQGLVFWAESKGLDVTYWTDNDLDQYGGQVKDRAGTLFLPGHDEYYSLRMRAAISQAIARGVNVANLGANTAYRLITFTDESRRSWDIDRYTDGYNSTTWRYQGDAYASQPLLGADYICAVTAGDLTTTSGWFFNGVPTGTKLTGFIAGEVDDVWPYLYKQPGQTTVASGNATCHTNGRVAPMETTVYTAPSGARVLNGSTFAYGCFLVARCPSNWNVTVDPAEQQAVATIVGNITEWVSRGTIDVPSDTTAAKVRIAVPKYKLETATQG